MGRSSQGGSPQQSPRRSPNRKQDVAPKSSYTYFLSGASSTSDPTKLHVAIKDNNISTIKDLLRIDKSLAHAQDKNGRTALHWSVVLGSHHCTKIILRNTSWWYIDRCDYNGCTPLHYAAQATKSEETRMLLNRGAYANARDLRGRTPLHYAVQVGNAFIIHKLVERKGNLWMRDDDDNIPLDLTEKAEVITLVHRLMEPRFSCFRWCYPKPSKEKVKLKFADKFPYPLPKGNNSRAKVNRCLPKNMLKDMMMADASRTKHDFEHKIVERKHQGG